MKTSLSTNTNLIPFSTCYTSNRFNRIPASILSIRAKLRFYYRLLSLCMNKFYHKVFINGRLFYHTTVPLNRPLFFDQSHCFDWKKTPNILVICIYWNFFHVAFLMSENNVVVWIELTKMISYSSPILTNPNLVNLGLTTSRKLVCVTRN